MIKYDVLNPGAHFVQKYDPTKPQGPNNLKPDYKTGWARGVLDEDLHVCTGVKRRTEADTWAYGLSPEWANDVSIDPTNQKLVGSGKMIFCFKAARKGDAWVPWSRHHMMYPSHFYVVWLAPKGTEFWSQNGRVNASELAFPYVVERSDFVGMFKAPGLGGVYPPIDTSGFPTPSFDG